MRKSHTVSAIVFALVCTILGGGLRQIPLADPVASAGKNAQTSSNNSGIVTTPEAVTINSDAESIPADEHTVLFDVDDAPIDMPHTQRVANGDRAEWPNPIPEWSGHWFQGWFTEDDLPWDFTTPVTASMKLTAKWADHNFSLPSKKGPVSGGTPVKVFSPGAPKNVMYTQVSAGEQHTLALGADGNVYAWGSNSSGQLGDESTNMASVPIRVHTPAGKSFVQVAAGDQHSLAVDTEGNLYAWGANDKGQLGLASQQPSLQPLPLPLNGKKFTAVSAGAAHSLAIDTDGKVWGWGSNNHGQVGNESTSDQLSPMPVNTITAANQASLKVKSISAGGDHSLAVAADGSLWAWGNNSCGQLGNNDSRNTDQRHPVKLTLTTAFQLAVAAGNYSLAIDNSGRLWSWGENSHGQLGDGGTSNRKLPARVSTDFKFTDVAAAADHSLAVDTFGQIWSWGANSYGQLGDDSQLDRLTPVQPVHPLKTKTVTAGGRHSVSLDKQGKVQTWGSNEASSLGRGDSLPPDTSMDKLPGELDLQHLLLTRVVFGESDASQPLQDTSETYNASSWSVTTPAHPEGEVDVTVYWSLGGLPQEQKTFTGGFTYGSPQKTTCRVTFNTPEGPDADPPVQYVKCGSLVKWPEYNVKRNAKFRFLGWFEQSGKWPWAFGHETVERDIYLVATWERVKFFDRGPSSGPAGGGTFMLFRAPEAPWHLAMVQVQAGHEISYALAGDGHVYAWGANRHGEAGDYREWRTDEENRVDRTTSVLVRTPRDLKFSKIACHDCIAPLAVDEFGDMWTWGRRDYGQLGDGKNGEGKIGSFTGYPQRIVPRTGNANVKFKEASAGFKFSMALDTEGNVWTWGQAGPAFGDGTNPPADEIRDTVHTRVKFPDGVNITKINASTTGGKEGREQDNPHAVALDDEGHVWVWGDCGDGRCGLPLDPSVTTPRQLEPGVRFIDVSAADNSTYAVDDQGRVWAWGERNNTTGMPKLYTDVTPYKQVAATGETVLAVNEDTELWVWGDNSYCQLGNANVSCPDPNAYTSEPAFIYINVFHASPGRMHSMLLRDEIETLVSNWGSNRNGRLGFVDYSETNEFFPTTSYQKTPRIFRYFCWIYAVFFDHDEVNYRGRNFSNIVWKWHRAVTPPHPPGTVEIRAPWNLAYDDYVYTDYSSMWDGKDERFTFLPYADLPNAGSIPLARDTGLLLLLLSSFTLVVLLARRIAWLPEQSGE